MGVPKFFRWLGECYPMIISRQSEPNPEVDNLYLDMNGIIHVCCRSEGFETSSLENSTEEVMIRSIYRYIEHIFQSIRPRKRFFMAIDGVAPRAKLNQQRQRRFRKVMSEETQIANGEFDSNSITPGTLFMLRLSTCLEYFVKHKVSTNAAWRSCEIIYSSHRDSGEGEHKIMDFIRNQRKNADFVSETHCLYGLDADLIMLALSTHMPNIILLREVVNFGSHWKQQKKMDKMIAKRISEDKSLTSPSEFVLLHIRILRDYLSIELQCKNLESSINDFVFLCFLLGNDFLPGLPGLSIADGAITNLLEIYSNVCIKNNCRIVNDGYISSESLKSVLRSIAENEWKFIQHQRSSFKKRNDEVESGILHNTKNIAEYKAIYYGQKLHFTENSELHSLAFAYIEGLVWVFHYYFSGCPDWSWYYRYHYAPLSSDLLEAVDRISDVHFTKNKPFTPYEQLLAVLPIQSHSCVPHSLQKLMTDPNSVLHKNDFYPNIDEIHIDREGCKHEWEGVMLLPFIDEKFLKSVLQEVSSSLSSEEKNNNQSEPALLFTYDLSITPSTKILPPFRDFPTITNSYVKQSVLNMQKHTTLATKMSQNFLPNGIGSLDPLRDHLSASFVANETRVFGQFSRNSSMIIDISKRTIICTNLRDAVGQIISVGFPYLKKALLLSVHEEDGVIQGIFDREGNLLDRHHHTYTPEERDLYHLNLQKITKDRFISCGLRIAKKQSLLHVHHILGTRLSDKGIHVLHFENEETIYPSQVCMIESKFPDRLTEKLTSESILSKEALVFSTGKHLQQIPRGLAGHIQHVYENRNSFRLCMTFPQEMRVDDHLFYNALPPRALLFASAKAWISSIDLCRELKLPHQFLFSICETIICEIDGESVQIGLQLLDRQANLGKVGFARCIKNLEKLKAATSNPMVPDLQIVGDIKNASQKLSSKKWIFSRIAKDLVEQYVQKFSSFVQLLPLGSQETIDVKMFCETDEKLNDFRSMVQKIRSFLDKKLSFTLKSDSKKPETILGRADENTLPADMISDIEKVLIENQSIRIPRKAQSMDNILLHSVFIPLFTKEDSLAIQNYAPGHISHPNSVLQRVVFCGTTGTVPFGATGCVVRLTANGYHAEVLFDDEHLECDRLGGRLQTFRGSVIKISNLLVIRSHESNGSKMQERTSKKKDQKTKLQCEQVQKNDKDWLLEKNITDQLQSKLQLENFTSKDKNAHRQDTYNEGTKEKIKSQERNPSPSIKEKRDKKCILGDSCLITNPTHLESFHSNSS